MKPPPNPPLAGWGRRRRTHSGNDEAVRRRRPRLGRAEREGRKAQKRGNEEAGNAPHDKLLPQRRPHALSRAVTTPNKN